MFIIKGEKCAMCGSAQHVFVRSVHHSDQASKEILPLELCQACSDRRSNDIQFDHACWHKASLAEANRRSEELMQTPEFWISLYL